MTRQTCQSDRGLKHIHGLIEISNVDESYEELDAVNPQDGEE